MKLYGDPFTLQEVRDSGTGLRPSYQELLSLIDMSDPAWPSVAAVLREMTEAGIEITRPAFDIAVRLGVHRLKMMDAGKPRKRRPAYHKIGLAAVTDSIVYYARRGKLVKIGTTTAPAVRFLALMPDEILAFEPGTIDHEKVRHRQFAHLRQRGELFVVAPELMEHTRSIRLMYGDPDPSWATSQKRSKPDEPPPVADGEMVTAVEAAERLGIKKDRVYGWVHRRLISPAGRNDRGVKVFCMGQMEMVLKRTTRPDPRSTMDREATQL